MNTLKSQTMIEALEKDKKELQSMLDAIETKGDNATELDWSNYETLENKVSEAAALIKRQQKLEVTKAELAKEISPASFGTGASERREERKAVKRYSMIKAINGQMSGKLDGIEKEMHEQAILDAKENNQHIQGVGMPHFFMEQKTALNVGSSTGYGDDMIATDLSPDVIGALRPRLLGETLGARVVTGLRGNLDISKTTDILAAAWEGEFDNNAETSLPTDKIQLTPNRLGAYTDIGKQWMRQVSFSAEAFVREELTFAIQKALDAAYFNGSGSSNEPIGILNTAGIGSVAIGTDGGAPSWGDIVDLETDVAVANGDFGSLAYVTTPGVRGKMKKIFIDAGSGQRLWDMNNSPVNGYRGFVTTNLPTNLTKGASTDCHPILFGNFADSIIANWGAMDIVVDPLTQALGAKLRIVINSWWDIKVRNAGSFSAIKDARIA